MKQWEISKAFKISKKDTVKKELIMLLLNIMKEESTKESTIKLSDLMNKQIFNNNKTSNSSVNKKEDFKRHSMMLKLRLKLKNKAL